jgi:hypothetical protein
MTTVNTNTENDMEYLYNLWNDFIEWIEFEYDWHFGKDESDQSQADDSYSISKKDDE